MDATNGGCTSARTSVIATVGSMPTVTGTTPGTRCGTGTVVLGATASAGTLNWYAASSGGTSLGTGGTFTTPSVSTTTSFFVDATNGGCTSSRSAVSASVNDAPSVSATGNNPQCNGSADGSITTSVTGGAPLYNYVWNTGATTSSIAGLSAGSYTVTVTDANGCSDLQVTTLSNPSALNLSTVMTQSTCPNNDGALNLSVSGGAGGYLYSWSTGATTQDVNALASGSYTVTVTDVNGCSSQNISAVTQNCISVPNTQLIASQCGATFTSLAGYFSCTSVAGASYYKFEFTAAGFLQEVNSSSFTSSPNVNKTAATGLQYGNTYNVRVKALVGGVWGNYGVSCPITLTPASTQMISTQCSATFTDIGAGTFNCNAISGATDYEWKFTSTTTSFTVTVQRGANYSSINRTWIPGLQYGLSYNVEVRAKVGGVYGTTAPVCTITVAPSSTQLISSQCNTSVNLIGNFNCNAVSGATDYEWNITGPAGYNVTRTRGTNSTAIVKSNFPGLVNGGTYTVRVRAKVGGVFGTNINTCNITINTSLMPIYSSDLREYEESNIETAEEKLIVYPNPSGTSGFDLMIAGQSFVPSDVIVTLFDIYGKSIWMKSVYLSSGESIKLNGDGLLKPGMYIINAIINGKSLNERVIVK